MFTLPDWPPWAVNTFIGCACFTFFVAVIQWWRDSSKDASSSDNTPTGDKAPAFRAFQRQYLLVFTIIMMADWFQGTNMYTLYSSYGVNISALFITGFLTGAIMAGPVGIMIDKYGRKRMCIVYLVLEIIINIMEHVNDFWTLWLSRVLGGITTNILFTGFEAWMNAEHRKRGFPQDWVADTFSKASFINGLSAITAGILAQVAADAMGEIGPFKVAIALTALALVFVVFWEENKGVESRCCVRNLKEDATEDQLKSLFAAFGTVGTITITKPDGKKSAEALVSLGSAEEVSKAIAGMDKKSVDGKEISVELAKETSDDASLEKRAWELIKTDRKVFLMGSVNALFEGSMYSFVFMWVPTMIAALGHFPPTGLVFASLMCCISLGGCLFSPSMLLSIAPAQYIGVGCFLVGAAALIVPVFATSLLPILGAFLVFEVCVGIFQPCGGVLRSKVIPDELTGSVTNMFRIPLNSLVVIGTLLTDYLQARYVFGIITCWMLLGACAQVIVIQSLAKPQVENGKKTE